MGEAGDDTTLITRPRRFGKTLNMSMLEVFFSNEYADRGDLFEGLEIWEGNHRIKMSLERLFQGEHIKGSEGRTVTNQIILDLI